MSKLETKIDLLITYVAAKDLCDEAKDSFRTGINDNTESVYTLIKLKHSLREELLKTQGLKVEELTTPD